MPDCLEEYMKHSQKFDDFCLDLYTGTLFKNGFTQMLYEEYENVTTLSRLGIYGSLKHVQIGLITVTSKIHTVHLILNEIHHSSQSWVKRIHLGGLSLLPWGFSAKANVVFIWFILNISDCLV